MSEITLYIKSQKLVTTEGLPLAASARPVIRWREQVTFTLRPASGTFPEGTYHYAFDHNRDFLRTTPCNAGECTLSDGVLTFSQIFNSDRQADATSGRRFPIPFFIQITRDETDTAEYVLDDTIWVDGCVWDGRMPPSSVADTFYNKDEMNDILQGYVSVNHVSRLDAHVAELQAALDSYDGDNIQY